MITFDGRTFATAAEVAADSKTKLSEKDFFNDASLRKHDTQGLEKFEIDGAKLVYCKAEQGSWHLWEWSPCLLFDGVVMHLSSWKNKEPQELTPYWSHRGDGELTESEKRELYSAQPQRVGAPNRKKLQAWADWCRKYIQAYDAADQRAKDTTAKNIAFLESIEGIKKATRRGNSYYELRRGGIKRVIHLGKQGEIFWNDEVDYEAKEKIFAEFYNK